MMTVLARELYERTLVVSTFAVCEKQFGGLPAEL